MNAAADADPHSLRISIDTKASVVLGDYSRGGKARGLKSVKALDHEMQSKDKLIPFGILNMHTAQLSLTFGTSFKTSDFLVDSLEQWWAEVKADYAHISTLVINCDNGPESSSHRTQFMYRLVEFAHGTGLRLRLVYYPPYHSKYNPIERCWAAMENHWNGTLLTTLQDTLEWAQSMTWKGLHPIVALSKTAYHKGVSLTKQAMAEVERFLQRCARLPKYDIVIDPAMG